MTAFKNTMLLIAMTWLAMAVTSAQDLADEFRTPPAEARPWVYWYWINGTMTRAGITADLESMQRVGIGGVMLMEVDHGTPAGPTVFASPAWYELFRFALEESARLGLQVNMANDAGWCGSGGPWITPELSMQRVVWSETVVEGPQRFDGVLKAPVPGKTFYRDIAVLAVPRPVDDSYRIPNIAWRSGAAATSILANFPKLPVMVPVLPASQIIDGARQVDVTPSFVQGRLTWEVPAGSWVIYRFGHTSSGQTNHPAPKGGQGLECDRLNPQAMDVHVANLLSKLIDTAGPLAGKTLVSTHIDSWESGAQNWTGRMREEFRQRRGYDLTRYLPVMTGRVVDSLEVSERFLWDLRATLAEMVEEHYAGRLQALAKQRGLRLSIEGYDWDFCNDMAYAGRADEPQGEFWNIRDPGGYRSHSWCVNMTSAAHTYGKPIVAAEAFTTMPQDGRWSEHPGAIKHVGDWAFCQGINRFLFHTFTMQPRDDLKPGMGMGGWGLHYERTQTWWEWTKPWHEYLTRCQHLLRQGLFVADLCYLQPEGAPMRFEPPSAGGSPELPDRPGYNYDGCTPEVVLTRMAVRDGRIVLPDGMNYRALVLADPGSKMPGAGLMTPQLLTKIHALVEAGATVIGSRPVRSPSLADYPACDGEVTRLSDLLWGVGDPGKSGNRQVGKGRVCWGRTPAEVLAGDGIPPDFACMPQPAALRSIHRQTEDGTDLYFVANRLDRPAEAQCSFRVVGKRPEWWWPESGKRTPVLAYRQHDGVTTIPMRLEAAESVFVVFRDGAEPTPTVTSVTRDGVDLLATGKNESLPVVDLTTGRLWQSGSVTVGWSDGLQQNLHVELPAPQPIAGSWQVGFDPQWGGPAQIVFDHLEDWSQRSEPGIKHYSGMASYRTTFTAAPIKAGQAVILDLGRVAVMAQVTLNGQPLGILWKPPFRVEVTAALRPGDNTLEVAVVNLWVNRLIGDEQLPADCLWGKQDWSGGQPLAEWPAWLQGREPRTSGRRTFTTWKLRAAADSLLPSGLLGPVELRTVQDLLVNP